MLDFAVLGFIALAGWAGYRRGMIRSLIGIVAFILAIMLSSIITPYVYSMLLNTNLSDTIHRQIMAYLGTGSGVSLGDMGLPTVLSGSLQPMVDSAIESTRTSVATAITTSIISLLARLLAFAFVYLFTTIVGGVLETVFSLPILKGINHLAGLLVGVLNGLLIVYIALAFIGLFYAIPAAPHIQDSIVTKYIYDNNILLQLFTDTLNTQLAHLRVDLMGFISGST